MSTNCQDSNSTYAGDGGIDHALGKMISLRKNLKREYPFGPQRYTVPDTLIQWSIPWPHYPASIFTAGKVLTATWADPEITDPMAKFKWNAIDGDVSRVSHEGPYEINSHGYPLNPFGRTGMRGRGVLGKWACNHAVDCLVTRLKRNSDDKLSTYKTFSGETRYCHQFIAIQRRDTGEWALPGGMIDAGEDVTTALKREFMEEVLLLDSDGMPPGESACIDKVLTGMLEGEVRTKVLYKGYVDDHRNTDNAWMETVCVHIPCSPELEHYLRDGNVAAGSDAINVTWIDIEPTMKMCMFANHLDFIKLFLANLNESD